MGYVILGIVGTFIWLSYEMWRAPLLEERPDGSWKTIKPTKKIKDLFKRKK
jgi:hypothetical protein